MNTCPFSSDDQVFQLDPRGQNLHADGAYLRSRGPVTQVEIPGGYVAWVITSHEMVKTLLPDPRISRDPSHWAPYANGEISEEWPLYTVVAVQNMFNAEGADHDRLREAAKGTFTSRKMTTFRPHLEQMVDALLDELAARPPGSVVDLCQEFAIKLPIDVLCALMGVPDSERAAMDRSLRGLLDSSATPEEALAFRAGAYQIINNLIAIKEQSPDDELVSRVIAARDDKRMSDVECVDTLLLLLSAGYETTVHLLANTVRALLVHPDQLELLRSGQATWRDVIAESLRYDPPGYFSPLRYAVEEIELPGGVVIRKGDPILTGFGPASRDPARHGADADAFDVTRPTRHDHVAFGYGPHRCIGAPLSLLEAEVALPALFDRFPDLALAVAPEQIQPSESFITNGYRAMPVTLGVQAAARPAGEMA